MLVFNGNDTGKNPGPFVQTNTEPEPVTVRALPAPWGPCPVVLTALHPGSIRRVPPLTLRGALSVLPVKVCVLCVGTRLLAEEREVSDPQPQIERPLSSP